MKFELMTFAFLSGAVILDSCAKDAADATGLRQGDEIVLVMDDSDGFSADTKVTAVNSMPGTLFWGASTGIAGVSDNTKWSPASGAVTLGKLSTGKYKASAAASYNYYVSNVAMTAAVSGWTVSASNTADVIAGLTEASASSTPTVTLGHIFARTGTLSLSNSGEGSAVVIPTKWAIVSKGTGTGTKGTYNVATGVWSGTDALESTVFTGQSDLYLIPGVYTVTVTYTKTLDGSSVPGCTASGDVSLTAGKINNVSARVCVSEPNQISLSVKVTDWYTGSEYIEPI